MSTSSGAVLRADLISSLLIYFIADRSSHVDTCTGSSKRAPRIVLGLACQVSEKCYFL